MWIAIAVLFLALCFSGKTIYFVSVKIDTEEFQKEQRQGVIFQVICLLALFALVAIIATAIFQ